MTTDGGLPPKTDNFFSPANFDFYAHQPYEPLDKDSHTIRLLAVTKDESGQLQCKLKVGIPLEEADGTYSAISYCAGDPKKIRTVYVDGKPFNAFANLAHAIEETYRYRSIEHGDFEAVLWTDQICINQSDLKERSHQVGFMGRIYSSACEVVICLSTEEERGSGSGVVFLQDIHNYLSSQTEEFPRLSTTSSSLPEYTHMYQSSKFLRYLSSAHGRVSLRNGWDDAMKLIMQPWWARAWVFQEYASAQNATFLYGGLWVTQEVMKVALLTLSVQYHSITSHFFDRSERLANLDVDDLRVDVCMSRITYMLSYCYSTDSNRRFIELLDHSRKCGATDGRDHVYAMLGLVDETYGMHVDYSEQNTFQAVFTQLARSMIENEGDLEVLAHAHSGFSVSSHLNLKHSMTNLPSWVPDWSMRNRSHWSLNSPAPTPWEPRYEQVPHPFDAKFLDDGTTLEVSGTYIDTMIDYSCSLSTSSELGYIIWDKWESAVGDQLWKLHGLKWMVLLRPGTTAFRFVTIVSAEEPPPLPSATKEASLAHFAAQMEKELVRIRLV